MEPTCGLFEEKLRAFLSGKPPLDLFLAHLRECPRCMAEVNRGQALTNRDQAAEGLRTAKINLRTARINIIWTLALAVATAILIFTR